MKFSRENIHNMSSTTANTPPVNSAVTCDKADREKINLSENDWIQVLTNLSPSSMSSLQETLRRLKDSNSVQQQAIPAIPLTLTQSTTPILNSIQLPTILGTGINQTSAPQQLLTPTLASNGQTITLVLTPSPKKVQQSSQVKATNSQTRCVSLNQPLVATALPLNVQPQISNSAILTFAPNITQASSPKISETKEKIDQDITENDFSFNSLNALATAAAQAASEIDSSSDNNSSFKNSNNANSLSISPHKGGKMDSLIVISSSEGDTVSSASNSPNKTSKQNLKRSSEALHQENVRTTRRSTFKIKTPTVNEISRKRNHKTSDEELEDHDSTENSQLKLRKVSTSLSVSKTSTLDSLSNSASFVLTTVKNSSSDQTYDHEVIEDDEIRKIKRRERNRVAAAKCRQRRQDQIGLLQRQVTSLFNVGESLKMELIDVKSERDKLELLISQHNDTNCSRTMALNPRSPTVDEMIKGYLPTLDKILVDDKFIPRNRSDGSRIRIDMDDDDDMSTENESQSHDYSIGGGNGADDYEPDVDIEGSASSSYNMAPGLEILTLQKNSKSEKSDSIEHMTVSLDETVTNLVLSSAANQFAANCVNVTSPLAPASRPTTLSCVVSPSLPQSQKLLLTETANLLGAAQVNTVAMNVNSLTNNNATNLLQHLTNRFLNPVASSTSTTPTNTTAGFNAGIWPTGATIGDLTATGHVLTPDRGELIGKLAITPTMCAPTPVSTPWAFNNQKFQPGMNTMNFLQLLSPSTVTSPGGLLSSSGGNEGPNFQLIRIPVTTAGVGTDVRKPL